ncbi:MAG: exo-alpha-sialidase [Blastocatellia bacterium]|nr:exo-alpha-sialidase [Blastocatellia bacterium]
MRVFVVLLLAVCFTQLFGTGLFAQNSDPSESTQPATNLSRSVGNASNPRITRNGNVVGVAYQDSVTGNGDVFFVRSIDRGGSFTPAENLSNSPEPSRNPSLAMQGTRTCIIWDENASRVVARGRSDESTPLSPVVAISNLAETAFGGTVLARDGKFFAFFVQTEKGVRQIFANASEDAGKTWGRAPVKVITTAGNVTRLSAIVTESGEIVLAWLEEGGNRIRLNVAVSRPQSVTFTDPQTLSANQDGTPYDIQLAGSSDRILVGWSQIKQHVARVNFALSATADRKFELVNVNIPSKTMSPAVAVAGSMSYIGWVNATDNRAYFSLSANGGAGDFAVPRFIATLSTSYTSVALGAFQNSFHALARRILSSNSGKKNRFDVVHTVSSNRGNQFANLTSFYAPVKQYAQPPRLMVSEVGEVFVIWVDTTEQSNDQIFFGKLSSRG